MIVCGLSHPRCLRDPCLRAAERTESDTGCWHSTSLHACCCTTARCDPGYSCSPSLIVRAQDFAVKSVFQRQSYVQHTATLVQHCCCRRLNTAFGGYSSVEPLFQYSSFILNWYAKYSSALGLSTGLVGEVLAHCPPGATSRYTRNPPLGCHLIYRGSL